MKKKKKPKKKDCKFIVKMSHFSLIPKRTRYEMLSFMSQVLLLFLYISFMIWLVKHIKQIDLLLYLPTYYVYYI